MIYRQMTWKNYIILWRRKKKSSYETQTVRKTLKGDSKQKRTLYIRPIFFLRGGSEGESWNALESYVRTLIHLMTRDS